MSRYDVQEWQWRLSLRTRAARLDALAAVRGILMACLLVSPFWGLIFFSLEVVAVRGGTQTLKAERLKAEMPAERFQVVGRTWTGDRIEIGFFYGRSKDEAKREAIKRKGHLLGGLRLEAFGRV